LQYKDQENGVSAPALAQPTAAPAV
jgi:hypothetical protein